MGTNGCVRMTCLDCGAFRLVPRRELNRAARVRCLQCGGPTEVSAMGRDRLATGQEAAREQRQRFAKRRGED